MVPTAHAGMAELGSRRQIAYDPASGTSVSRCVMDFLTQIRSHSVTTHLPFTHS